MPFKKPGKSKFGARGPGRSFGSDRPPRFDGPRSGGRSFGNKPFSRPGTLFDLKCDKCGKDCQVPFKPTTGKPVYCRDCFKGGDDARPKRGFDRPDRSSPSSDELAEINAKLDKIMASLGIE